MEMYYQNEKDEVLNQSVPLVQDEWKFRTPEIILPDYMHNFFDKILEADFKECKGLYSNSTDMQIEDEDDDDFLMVEAYGFKGSLEPYYRKLQQYGVMECLFKDKEVRNVFWSLLKHIVTFIRDNTTKPNKARNEITNTLKIIDNIPGLGLIWQILLLQGLYSLFEKIDINEGDNGFDEAQELCNWTFEQLLQKELWFCHYFWSDEDKEILKPICNYLYSTEVGKVVQCYLFGVNETDEDNEEYCIKIDGDTEQELLKNYNFWNLSKEKHKHIPRYKNIFEDITLSEFLNIVKRADFSTLSKKKGCLHRLLFNIAILSRLLGNEWGGKAAESIGKTLAECQKRTDFEEYMQLKGMYLQ